MPLCGRNVLTVLIALTGLLLVAAPIAGDSGHSHQPAVRPPPTEHAPSGFFHDWPTSEQWARVVLLRDHNTRVVILGATILGLAAGVIGSFTLLRKRALMGDALSHATLPGIGLAFVLGTLAGMTTKSLLFLLLGAAVTGVAGVGVLLFLRRCTRLKEDTALGVVLSVFFGAGIALLGIVQQLGTGSAAGLETFIYGKTASMVPGDVMLIGIACALVLVVCALLFKEFKLLCFDQAYATVQGWPVLGLDIAMMSLVVVVTVVGLQAVGLVLIIAMLIIPAAAARFWFDRMLPMTILAGVLGALSATAGTAMSAVFARLPSGAVIVIVTAVVFVISMIFGPARGVLPRCVRRWALQRKTGRQHLLRAAYEWLEAKGDADAAKAHPIPLDQLLRKRSWTPRRLHKLARRARRAGQVEILDGSVELTERGRAEAARITRNHRLWEMYLITYADIAPSHVDRDADMIEHILNQEMIAELETLVGRANLAQPH